MSVKLMSLVFDISMTKGNDRMVLLVLADACNDDGDAAWPSVARIARKANVGLNAARVSLLCLRETGVISWVARFKKGGGQTSNGYKVNIEMIGKDNVSKELRARMIGVVKGKITRSTPEGYGAPLYPRGVAAPLPPVGFAPSTPEGVTTHPVTHPFDSSSAAPAENKPKATFASVKKLYSSNVGIPTPIILDSLQDAVKLYSAEWVELAITEAVNHNGRSWAYIEKILINWKQNGINSRGQGKPSGPAYRNGNGHAKAPAAQPLGFDVPQMNRLLALNMDAKSRAYIAEHKLTFEQAVAYLGG